VCDKPHSQIPLALSITLAAIALSGNVWVAYVNADGALDVEKARESTSDRNTPTRLFTPRPRHRARSHSSFAHGR
jgi:hypothetical protein